MKTKRPLIQQLFEDREISSQEAIYGLCDYLLGENYYIVDPVSSAQANAIIVDEILCKYSKKYRKERAAYVFNRDGGKEVSVFGLKINIKKEKRRK